MHCISFTIMKFKIDTWSLHLGDFQIFPSRVSYKDFRKNKKKIEKKQRTESSVKSIQFLYGKQKAACNELKGEKKKHGRTLSLEMIFNFFFIYVYVKKHGLTCANVLWERDPGTWRPIGIIRNLRFSSLLLSLLGVIKFPSSQKGEVFFWLLLLNDQIWAMCGEIIFHSCNKNALDRRRWRP